MNVVTPKDLGSFPANGEAARDAKLFYKLDDEHGIRMISGRKTPALLNFWAGNDVVNFGNIRLLAGGPRPQQTEFDSHRGDAVFYVTEGPMTFFIRDRRETYDVQLGDFMFIPAGETYKIINFYAHTAKAVFMIAPTL